MSEERKVPEAAEAITPLDEDVRSGEPGPADREARIRQAAYARYEKRGAEPGHDVEDWLAAETEIETTPAAEPSSDKSA